MMTKVRGRTFGLGFIIRSQSTIPTRECKAGICASSTRMLCLDTTYFYGEGIHD
jgi:hypothetical protein